MHSFKPQLCYGFKIGNNFLRYDFIKLSSGCLRNLLCKFIASQTTGENQIYKFVYFT